LLFNLQYETVNLVTCKIRYEMVYFVNGLLCIKCYEKVYFVNGLLYKIC
jgi:hypothetical protein